ncbi:MAG TPA: OmpA family protein [Gemmatimonadales bacterium]|jgi:outer membrane protein OmpA-like peptidoglycan-associated protein|nr:OmpA family protein [Gemmatimonadales bacterium]
MPTTHRLYTIAVLLAAASSVGLTGCATKAQTGAVVGAAGGAVVGGVIGRAAGSTAKGAIIGATVGGIAGTLIGQQMDKQARELSQNIKGAKVERVGEGIQVTFESGLMFDFDSDALRPEALTNLHELAVSLDQYPKTDIVIVGHTDQLGSTTYNQGLSERRANSAASYLMTQGVRGSRLVTHGMGETEPIATNETEAGRQANRRIEVAIFANAEARAEAARGQ